MSDLISDTTMLINSVNKLQAGISRVEEVAGLAQLESFPAENAQIVYAENLGLFRFKAGSVLEANDVSIVESSTAFGRWIAIDYPQRNVADGLAGLDDKGRLANLQIKKQVVTNPDVSDSAASRTTLGVNDGYTFAFTSLTKNLYCTLSGVASKGDMVCFYADSDTYKVDILFSANTTFVGTSSGDTFRSAMFLFLDPVWVLLYRD